jgi:hypothetical protein
MRHRLISRFALALGLASAVAACGLAPGDGDAGTPRGARLDFADREAPEVLEREGAARRAADDAASGLWGVIAGLRRPERALVRNVGSGAEVEVALYGGSAGSGAVIRLSPQASDILGILESPVQVRVVALRREPRIVRP